MKKKREQIEKQNSKGGPGHSFDKTVTWAPFWILPLKMERAKIIKKKKFDIPQNNCFFFEIKCKIEGHMIPKEEKKLLKCWNLCHKIKIF